MIHLQSVSLRIGGRLLLDRASVALGPGQKASLVGRNGTGKSTLLRAIQGEMPLEAGDISMPKGARLGALAQEAPDAGGTLMDTVLSADKERARLLDEAETATDPNRIAEIHIRLADIDAHSAESRAARILSGLGFSQPDLARPLHDFSGGWRMRAALAGMLFSAPDLLILDEPTNHLDLEATLWLEGHLQTYPHTLLFVSHDRDLLNNVPDVTIHLAGQKLTAWKGGYDAFRRAFAEAQTRSAAMIARQEQERARLQAFVDRFRAKASKATQAQSRVKMLEKMAPIAALPTEEAKPNFTFTIDQPLAPPILTLEHVDIGYGERVVLRDLSLRLDQDDRVALLGANGNGKSTLVKLLSGRLEPMAGTRRQSSKLKIGYFAQHQTDDLPLESTALAATLQRFPKLTAQQARSLLGRFGFSGPRAETVVGDLSGGEKARLLFAYLAQESPQLLLLDEPTNHLDIEAREALIEAINAYEGAVVLVSHDPHLLSLTVDRLWLVANGTVTAFDGSMDDYRQSVLQKPSSGSGGGKGKKGERKQQDNRAPAEKRSDLKPLRAASQKAEQLVAQLTAKKAQLSGALADPTLYNGPAEKLQGLQKDMAAVETQLEAAELAWMEALERLEAAS